MSSSVIVNVATLPLADEFPGVFVTPSSVGVPLDPPPGEASVTVNVSSDSSVVSTAIGTATVTASVVEPAGIVSVPDVAV